MSSETGKRRRRRRSQKWGATLIAAIIGVALTIWSWAWLEDSEQARLQAHFERDAAIAGNLIQSEVEELLYTGRALAALFDASEQVESGQFVRFVESFALPTPRLESAHWIEPVVESDRPIHEAKRSPESDGLYRIVEREAGRWVSAQSRPLHYPSQIIAAESADAWITGFDWASIPMVAEGLENVRDDGLPSLVGPFPVLPFDTQTAQSQTYFGVAAPVYQFGRRPESVEARRESLQGFVLLVTRTLTGTEEAAVTSYLPRLRLYIVSYDGEEPLQIVHDGSPKGVESLWQQEEVAEAGHFLHVTELEANRGDVKVHIVSTDEYLDKRRTHIPWAILVPGLVATAVLMAFVFTQVGRSEDVQELIRLRTRELVEARERAEDATRAKGEFLANMSHEIRTPMNGVLGMLELLYGTELKSEQKEYVRLAEVSARGLLNLINDILDFSKIEARRLQLQDREFSLGDSIGETLQVMADRAAHKDLDLVYHLGEGVPSRLVGDPDRLRQVLINLVGNAIKFTHHGQICIRVQVEEAEDEHDESYRLHFEIHDTGEGIAEEKQALIFEAFRQADASSTRRFGGTGLGLTIAAQLVELMDGEVWLESEIGRGSTFHFTARFQSAETQREHRHRRAGYPADTLVLVVDDNHTNRKLFGELLERWKMTPVVVDSPERALELVEREDSPFDLVLTDLQMPTMSGLELARKIREASNGAELPILLLSSGGTIVSPSRMKAAGIARQILKPVRPSSLFDAIVDVLGTRDYPEQDNDGASASPALRVLLAEDNPINQRVTVGLLESRGHEVVLAENGQQAVDIFREGPDFDMILMDIQMPELDGYEATAAIRELEVDGAKCPIVALTAHAMEGDREQILAAGMDGYLAKPIAADELYEAVETYARGDR